MKLLRIGFLAAAVSGMALLSPSSFAQQKMSVQQELELTLQTIRTLCLSGKNFQISADASGNITFQFNPGASGRVSFDSKSTEGAVGYLDEKIRANVDTETRSCLREELPKVLNIIRGGRSGQVTGAAMLAGYSGPPLRTSPNDIQRLLPTGQWKSEGSNDFFVVSTEINRVPLEIRYVRDPVSVGQFNSVTMTYMAVYSYKELRSGTVYRSGSENTDTDCESKHAQMRQFLSAAYGPGISVSDVPREDMSDVCFNNKNCDGSGYRKKTVRMFEGDAHKFELNVVFSSFNREWRNGTFETGKTCRLMIIISALI